MTMPGAIASTELTTLERMEFLLGVLACAATGKRPHELFPWVRAGIDDMMRSVRHG